MLDLTAIKARRNLLPPGQFIAKLGSGEHVCTALYAEQGDGTLSFVADFWPDYELKLTPVRHAMSTMKAFMAYPADIDSLIAEVERLTIENAQLLEDAQRAKWINRD